MFRRLLSKGAIPGIGICIITLSIALLVCVVWLPRDRYSLPEDFHDVGKIY